jgi:hypothetical protein
MGARQAFHAGRDVAIYGPDPTNCHFRYFGTRGLTAQWERGNKAGHEERDLAAAAR